MKPPTPSSFFKVAMLSLLAPLVFAGCTLGQADSGESGGLSYGEVFKRTHDLSDEELKRLLRKAEGGDAESSFRLSLYFEIAREYPLEGFKWLVLSAEQGGRDAACNLGVSYCIPEFRNFDRSLYWMATAKDRGHPKAAEELQRIKEIERQSIEASRSKPQFEAAAGKRKPQTSPATTSEGSKDLTNDELDQLVVKARGGNADSCYRLSHYYAGKRRYWIEGYRWLVASAELGNGVAAYELGVIYATPARHNFERAGYWMKIALERGNAKAAEGLRMIEKQKHDATGVE